MPTILFFCATEKLGQRLVNSGRQKSAKDFLPEIHNEANEDKLINRLKDFLVGYKPLKLMIKGVKTFGNRVIYLGVEAEQELYDFQSDLKTFCKRELNLVDELSDRNFHPHMTIAFKDIKKSQFQNILKFSNEKDLAKEWTETQIVLLKKEDGRWILCERLKLG